MSASRFLGDIFLIILLYSQPTYPFYHNFNLKFYRNPTNFHASSENPDPIRLNKAFKSTHSRREADKLIASGRVLINGNPPTGAGDRITPYVDVVTLDGNRVDFEELNVVDETGKTANQFVYVKFWKPKGVVCTTNEKIKNNIITELQRRGMDTDFGRVYPVGRLDKETHGLILVTNDGRLPNAALRSQFKKEKVYEVEVDYELTHTDLSRLRSGIVITTVAQRDGKKVPLTAPTKPCKVEMISDRKFRITLTEGRNRQIRRMCQELDLEVVELKRVSFMGIDGEGMRVGEWRPLDGHEMSIIESAIYAKEEEKKELRDWSTSEVGEWVEKAGFPKYKESFLDSDIDGDRLLYLGTPDQVDHLSFHLAELGVSKSDLEEMEENIVRLCEEEG